MSPDFEKKRETDNVSEIRPTVHMTSDLIKTAYAGSIVYPPGGTFGPRIQKDVQLVMLHSGSLTLYLDDERHDVTPGTMLLLKPGHREHFLFSKTEDSWHRWITCVVGDLPESLAESLERMPFMLPLADTMNRIVDVMLACQSHSSPAHDRLMRTLALSALQLFEAESHVHAELRRIHRAVLLCKAAIRDRYAEDLQLKDLASAVHVSPEYLVRLFRQYEGTTPIHYLWRYRLERSVELLRGTGLSIHEIALRIGFKNGHHFSRAFRKWMGRTPSEYRNVFVRLPTNK